MPKTNLIEGRYSKVSRRIWSSRDFKSLSSARPNAQTLWLRLMIAPEQTALPGLLVLRKAGLAEELGWTMRSFRRCFAEIITAGMANHDEKTGLLWMPHGVNHNQPDNPNVVKGWALAWRELPECDLKTEAQQSIAGLMRSRGQGFYDAFDQVTGNHGPNVSAPPDSNHGPNVGPNSAKQRKGERKRKGERDPQPPISSPEDRPPPRDPMRASLEPTRPDVVAVWDAWKVLADKPNAELTRRDGRYELIVDRLDRYGEEAVRDALLGAKHDDWCQGRADGVKHLRLTYILGENKPEKFEELQAAGERIRTKLSRQRVAHDHERELDRRERRDRKQVDPVKTQGLIDKAIAALERGRKG